LNTTSATAPAPPSGEPVRDRSLATRVLGVLFSPRATYAAVAAHPRALGVLLIAIVLSAGASAALLSTQVGQDALIDQQIRLLESFGMTVSDQMYAQMQARLDNAPYITVAGTAAGYLVGSLVVAGILIAVFNAALGGNARFKQVYTVVAHSFVIPTVQRLFASPLDYAKQSLSSPTNLGVFTPFLDEGSFPALLLGSIDLFVIWWIVNLAIGVGVLYRKRTTPIATTLLIVYAVIVLVVAAARAVLSGV
jgi:hypothetical protein